MQVKDLLVEINRSLETIDTTKELVLRIVYLIAILAVLVVIVLCAIVFDLRHEIFEEIYRNKEVYEMYRQMIQRFPYE